MINFINIISTVTRVYSFIIPFLILYPTGHSKLSIQSRFRSSRRVRKILRLSRQNVCENSNSINLFNILFADNPSR